MQLVNILGFRANDINVNSQQVVIDINTNNSSNITERKLISKIISYFCQDNNIKISHAYHKSNLCEDALVRNGILYLDVMCNFDSFPPFITHLVESD